MSPTIKFGLPLLLATAMAATPADASVPWRTGRVTIHADQRSIVEILKEFADSQGITMTIDKKLKGTINGDFTSVDTESFLNALCDAAGFSWFYDGAKLHIESAEEIVSRSVILPHLNRDRIDNVLVSLGYSSGPDGKEFEMKSGDRPGVMIFKGAPSFVQSTEVLTKDLDDQEASRIKEAVAIRTFHLKYASATDVTIKGSGTGGGSNVVIPGVARALQNVMGSSQGNPFSTGPQVTERPVISQSLAGQGLIGVGQNASYEPQQMQQPQQRRAVPQARGKEEEDPSRKPLIVADPRTNSVFVRDVEERMPLYEEVIKQLDVPTKVIQISAAVVDVNKDNLGQFGAQWLSQSTDKNGNITRTGFNADSVTFQGSGTSLQSQGLTPGFVDGSNLVRGGGLNVSALIGDSANNLLSRLQANESLGYSKIVSSPSVLTLENVDATIRSDQTIHVRVPGYAATDLYDVTAGVDLSVNTSVLDGDHGRVFRMILNITDGNFTTSQVDSIPGKTESSINTQAMIPDGRTLLIGGYVNEQQTDNKSQIPFLGRIPVIGRLFGNTSKEHSRSQRFFFITPRVVNVDLESTVPVPGKGKSWMEANLDIPKDLTTKETSPEKVEHQARDLSYDAWRAWNPGTYGTSSSPVPDSKETLNPSTGK